MPLLHEGMMEIVRPLADTASVSFEVGGVGKYIWNLFPIIVSYCCNIPEGKDMLCAKHAISVMRPCVKCPTSKDDIHDLPESDRWQLGQTMLGREKCARLIKRDERMDKDDV